MPAGSYVFHEGDPADSLLIVSSGRLRVYVDGEPRNEIGSCEVFGELGLLTGGTRTSSVRAVRDSELVALPVEDFNRLVDDRPAILRRITRSVVERMTAVERGPDPSLRTVSFAVVALDMAQPLFDETVAGLVEQLRTLGAVASLREGDAPDAPVRGGWARRLEADHRYLVYQVPSTASSWFEWSVRRADRVVLLAEASPGPDGRSESVGARVRSLAPLTASKLVLLQRAGTLRPRSTSDWLRRVTPAEVGGGPPCLHARRGSRSDLARVARVVAGRANGLVLSGGGARGFAHLGVMRALDEAGVAVDVVGGTSIGALMGAYRALDLDDPTRHALALRGLVHSGYLFPPALPVVALSSGRKIGRLLEEQFGGLDVEDCWIPYFAVAASLTRAELVVAERGRLTTAIRSSLSLPAILPPVRHEDDLLVDGGVLNNRPTDLMRERVGDGAVIAVDLEVATEMFAPSGYSEGDPAWRMLLAGTRSRRGRRGIPGPFGVLLRSLDLANVRSRREMVLQNAADLEFRPPVAGVARLDFATGRHLVDAAYHHARRQLERGPLPAGLARVAG